MRLYLGSKMIGVRDFGHPDFHVRAAGLRALGYTVFNPAEKDEEHGFTPSGLAGTEEELHDAGFSRRLALAIDMDWIARYSEGMVVFGDWRESRGCRAEVVFHHALGLPVWEYDDFTELGPGEIHYGVRAPMVGPLTDQPENQPTAAGDTDPEGIELSAALRARIAARHAGEPGVKPCAQCGATGKIHGIHEGSAGQANPSTAEGRVRTFDTGADRDTDTGKPDFEGVLSPLALRHYANYMTLHRVRRDGTLRDSDNWQRGMPLDVYMKSMLRHVVDVWTIHRGDVTMLDEDGQPIRLKDALAAALFNVQGYLHEILKAEADQG